MSGLKLLSSMAPKELLKELAARYEERGGRRILLEAAGGVEVARRVRGGEPLDIVVLARNSIDELAQEGSVEAAGVSDIAASGIGIAVKAGSQHPRIGDADALRQSVAAARSLSYSTGPSGVYLEKLFASWGILQDLKPRIVVPPPGTPVGRLVSEGRAELGFQQLSELIGVGGIEVIGPLPKTLQLLTTFAGAVSRKSQEAEAAKDFLGFMASPDHARIRAQWGMQ